MSDKTVIGWTEFIDFVEWNIRGLRAKVDTGARSSALHVEDLTVLPGGHVRFHVILSRHHRNRRVEVIAPVVRWAKVRSSNGEYHRRCFVRTTVTIGHVEKEIEVSLVSREKMQFRMLLGRQAIQHDFLVDVSKHSVLGDGRRRPAAKPVPTRKKRATKRAQ